MSTKVNKEKAEETVKAPVVEEVAAESQVEAIKKDIAADENPADLPSFEDIKNENSKLREEANQNYNSYLRALADADNAHKNYLKERKSLLKYRYEGLAKELLPVMDDFERCLQAMESYEQTADMDSAKKGVQLIYNKLVKALFNKGITKIAVKPGDEFTTDLHDAITAIPVTKEEDANKVIDCTEAGYKLEDKVIRYAKVVIGNYNAPATPVAEETQE